MELKPHLVPQLRWNSKTQIMMKLNSYIDETQELKLLWSSNTIFFLWNSKTQIFMKLKNSKCDKTQKLKLWQNWNCDKTQKFERWQNQKTLDDVILKRRRTSETQDQVHPSLRLNTPIRACKERCTTGCFFFWTPLNLTLPGLVRV